MDAIAVIKPNMTVLPRAQSLSFGQRTLAFAEQIGARSRWRVGQYRTFALDLFDQSAAVPVPTARPLQLRVDLKVALDAAGKRAKTEKEQAHKADRILERIYLLEKRTEQIRALPTRVTVQMDVPKTLPTGHRQAVAHTAHAAQQTAVQVGRQTADAIQHMLRIAAGTTTVQREQLGRLPAPLQPVTRSTAAPAGNGWNPCWQDRTLPYRVKPTATQAMAGSILLPDLLRKRRRQALAMGKIQGQSLHHAERMDLLEQRQDAEQHQSLAMRRMIERLSRAVNRAVYRSTEGRSLDARTQVQTQTEREERPNGGRQINHPTQPPPIVHKTAHTDADDWLDEPMTALELLNPYTVPSSKVTTGQANPQTLSDRAVKQTGTRSQLTVPEIPLAMVRPLALQTKQLEPLLGRHSHNTDPVAPTLSDDPADVLSYLSMSQPGPTGASPAPKPTPTETPAEQLPAWAQRFFKQSSDSILPSLVKSAPPPTQSRQIEWTAPNTMPRPANLVYQEPASKSQLPSPSARLSDHELRRAADKVYHMIEERLRKELRRSGR